MTLIEMILLAIGLAGGVLAIPVLTFGLGSALPTFLAEGVANALLATAVVGSGGARLHQTDTGRYELRPADQLSVGVITRLRGALNRDEHTDTVLEADGGAAPDRLEPESYWTRFAMGQFGISFEVTPDAFDDIAADYDPRERYPEEPDLNRKASTDIERGGLKTYVDLSERAADVWVPIGEALSRLRGQGGISIHLENMSEALEEYGGDTKGLEMKWQAIGMGVFTFVGLGMGYVIFF